MTDESGPRSSTRLTRDELYQKVWETPLSRLAVQFGISDNGLAKICRRLNVPYPPRGHWAKKAAGKKVAQLRLPNADATTPQEVTITPTPPLSEQAPTPETQASLDQARAQVPEIPVPERLLRPHPIVGSWIADHERRAREARLERDPWRRRLSTPNAISPAEQRRHRILNALFKEIERRGGQAKESDRRELYIELLGEKIEIQLREKQKQVRRPLTEEEKSWSYNKGKETKPELQPSGRLVFSIKTYLDDGLRREWLEKDDQPLEGMLPDIVATLETAAPLLVQRRRRHEEDEKRRRLEETKRYEQEQRRKLERNRLRRFTDFAKQWRDVQLARDFLSALKAGVADQAAQVGDKTVSDWLASLDESLAGADPLAAGVEAIIEDVNAVMSWTYRD